MTAPELLPCPFCGLSDFITIHSVGSLVSSMPDRPYQVRCRNMDCEDAAGPVAYGKYNAIAAWNRRTPSPEVAALIAETRREGWNAAIEAADKACDPSSYQAHHASVRRRCQTAIRALKEETP